MHPKNMHSTKLPYMPLSTKGLETHDPEGNFPPGVAADYRPEQMYAHSRHDGVVVTQPRTVFVNERTVPPDYLWLSCCSVFFCWPLAFIAVSKSRESARHAENGDYSKALESGQSARNIAVGSIVVGLLLTIILVVMRLNASCDPNC